MCVKIVHGSVRRLRLSFPKSLGQLRYARKTKRYIIFLIIELFPLAVRFSLLKYLIWEKYCNYPLFTTQGDRFTSYEKIVSRSQTPSLFPLPPAKYYLWCSHINVIIYVTGKSKLRNFAHLVFADKNIASSQITMNDLKVIQKTKQTSKQNN